MKHTNEAQLVHRARIERLILPAIERGEIDKLKAHIETVAENVYDVLPSGDFGRGDVREVILEVIQENE